MQTLQNIRPGEGIKKLEGEVLVGSDMVYVTVELQRREGSILVFMNHSDDIVSTVLGGIDPEDSGYIFFSSELGIDPINNCMVPKHREATEDEIEGLRNRRIPLNKLPIIRMLDPVRRWYNFRKGTIVAIERNGSTGNTYFRRVA